MSMCDKKMAAKRKIGAPWFVPLGLVITGLCLLPFDCVYNQILALMIIAIGTVSMSGHVARIFCGMKSSGNPA